MSNWFIQQIVAKYRRLVFIMCSNLLPDGGKSDRLSALFKKKRVSIAIINVIAGLLHPVQCISSITTDPPRQSTITRSRK